MINISRELKAVGLPVRGLLNGEPNFTEILSEVQQEIASAIIAAHNKTSADSEWLALKVLLGEVSNEWAVYVEVRKTPIRQQREERYKTETDPLRLKLDEDFIPNSPEWVAGLEVWKSAKNIIRGELPYPE